MTPQPAPKADVYLLGHSADEEERLRRLPRELAPDAIRFLDRLGIRPGARAVDIGCGPRGVLDLLSERVGPAGRVVGIERNEQNARMAQQFVADRQLRNVDVLVGDAKATGLPRACFDLVHARLVLVNVPEPQRVLEEMVALARPGGLVASHEADWAVSFCYPPSPAWEGLLAAFQAYSQSQGVDLFIGRKTFQMFRAAGLVDVEVTPLVYCRGLGSNHRNLLIHFVHNVRDGLLQNGFLTPAEFDEQVRELERHLEDPGTLVVPDMYFQVSGRKPV